MKSVSKRHAVTLAAGAILIVTVAVRTGAQQPPAGAPPQGRAQQTPPPPAGPLAPEKYKNIHVLTEIPAAQLDTTMRFFVAATGIQCIQCHVQDAATGEWQYEKDDKTPKRTAREMITMVKAINAGAGDYGLNGVNCGTCHAGRNQPAGLQLAVMMTPDQIAAAAAQAAAQAARQGGAGRGGAAAPGGQRGAPPAGGAAGAPGQGRGAAPAGPPVDDVLAKYLEALGGRAAVEKLQSISLTGTVTNHASVSMPFAIDAKGAKYRESVQSQPDAVTRAFDGTTGWIQAGTKTEVVSGFALDQMLRADDLMLALKLKDKYTTVTAGRPTRLTPVPGATPIDVNVIQATIPSQYLTEQFLFDATSGLLLRRTARTATALRGSLSEQYDYSDYRAVGGVKIPFEVKRTTNWNTLDTYKVTDAKANPSIDDAKFGKPKG